MGGSTFGTLFRLTSFGESHGAAIGGVVDGCPAGLTLNLEAVQKALDRRRPGQSRYTTQRRESDTVEWLSGLFEGRTTGAPIAFIIRNSDHRPADYDHLKDVFRPSHADYTYQAKYGLRDYRGGGRSSARTTASCVVGGEIARQILQLAGVNILAWVSSIGEISYTGNPPATQDEVETSILRCPDAGVTARMESLIKEVSASGDSLGGTVTCLMQGVPAGWGEPVFDKLEAMLAHAVMSINAVKGVEFGSGFAGSASRGSAQNDAFVAAGDGVSTQSNNSGGIQGGISNGQPVLLRAAFKPVATIAREQQTTTAQGEPTVLAAKGRHDPVVVPRAVPIVEAMCALALCDAYLRSRTNRINQL